MITAHIMAPALALMLSRPVGIPQDQNWVPGKRFVESATKVLGGIQRIIRDTPYGYNEDTCILGAFLTNKGEIGFGMRLEAGEKYAIIGGGDDGVIDLDIRVTDPNGTKIAEDVKNDAIPVVEFRAGRAGTYTLKVIMADAARNGGFATIGILKVGGFTVPVDNLARALANLIAGCESIDRQTRRDVLFMSGGNQWAVFGSIIRQGNTSTIESLTPGSGTRVLIAGADTTCDDADLYLLDSRGGVLKKDEDADARPQVVFEASSGTRYGFKVKNVKSRGASLVLVAMLQVG